MQYEPSNYSYIFICLLVVVDAMFFDHIMYASKHLNMLALGQRINDLLKFQVTNCDFELQMSVWIGFELTLILPRSILLS